MKQVNLIPVAVRQKALARRAVPYIILAAIIGTGAAGAAWLGFSLQVRLLQNTKDNLAQQEADREAADAKNAQDFQVNADLLSRVNTLNTLAKSDINWNKVFAYVAALIPKDITLGNYSLATAGGPLLKITGKAPSNVSYATFAQYLNDKKGTLLTDFTVDGYTYEPATGQVTFSVTVKVPLSAISFPAQ